MRRFRVVVAVLAAAVLGLTACGGGSTEHKTTLKLYNDKGAWKPYFQQLNATSKKQIGLTTNPVGYTDEPTYQSFIKASFRTKNKPDLFTWQVGSQLSDIATTGQVADTSDIWNQAIKSGDLTQDVKKYYTVDGKQYCVPLNVSYWVMFYNKKVFAEAGAKPPASWADLMADAQKLKAHGVTPFYQTNILFSFVWFQQLLLGTDPQLYEDLSTGKAKYTDPGVVAVMKQWKGMIDKGYMSDAGDKTDPGALLKSGKVAMVPDGTWFNTTMSQLKMKPGSDYGTFVIPNVNPALSTTSMAFESGPLCSLTKAPDPDASQKYLKWWVGKDAQQPWASSRGDVSANPKVTSSDPNLTAVTKQANSSDTKLYLRYFEAAPPPVLTAALDAFGAFLADPASYQKQLQTIQQAADQYWSQHK
ncbi:MAG TPA: extracellular solute-binding protein [Actinocatenispora sp.]